MSSIFFLPTHSAGLAHSLQGQPFSTFDGSPHEKVLLRSELNCDLAQSCRPQLLHLPWEGPPEEQGTQQVETRGCSSLQRSSEGRSSHPFPFWSPPAAHNLSYAGAATGQCLPWVYPTWPLVQLSGHDSITMCTPQAFAELLSGVC